MGRMLAVGVSRVVPVEALGPCLMGGAWTGGVRGRTLAVMGSPTPPPWLVRSTGAVTMVGLACFCCCWASFWVRSSTCRCALSRASLASRSSLSCRTRRPSNCDRIVLSRRPLSCLDCSMVDTLLLDVSKFSLRLWFSLVNSSILVLSSAIRLRACTMSPLALAPATLA
uniref:Putative secreted protein n=1 Tax=Ixodes ricinus TaxID=34613 RepID=A0A6B0UYR0_IXORI